MTFKTPANTSLFLNLYIGFFLTILFSVYGFSQKSGHLEQLHRQEFRFNPSARAGSASAVNDLLQILAEGSGRLRVFTGYDLSCKLMVNYDFAAQDRSAIYLSVTDITLTGDVFYKAFSISSYLLPPFLDLVFVTRMSDGSVLNELKLENIQWQTNPLNNLIFSSSLNNGRSARLVSLELKRVDFHYGDSYHLPVDSLQSALTNYYKADEKINQITQMAEGLANTDFDTVILDEFHLCEAELMAGGLHLADLNELLSLNMADPLNVVARLDSLNSHLAQIRDHFNFTISHIDSLLYQEGQELLIVERRLQARECFERALVYNPLHMPSHIALGKMDIQDKNPRKAIERFHNRWATINPPLNYRDQTVEFLDFLCESETERANAAMQDGRFLDALNILVAIERLCSLIQMWDCPEALFHSISSAHYGMYQSYLSVARRAYTSVNYSFAVSYVENALDYRNQNVNYISSNTEAMGLLQQILKGYYKLADEAFQRNDFREAANSMNAAVVLCEKYQSLHCRPDAIQLAQKAEEMKLSAHRMTVPVMVYEPAIQMPELTLDEAKSTVLQLLSQGHLKAWADEIVEAREFLNQLMPYAIRYNLREDEVINARIISLTQMIAAKECELVERDLMVVITAISNYSRRGYYLEAQTNYAMALNMLSAHTTCLNKHTDTLNLFSFIETAAAYQQLMHEAQDAYFRAGQRGFDLFFEKHDAAGVFYANNLLQDHGIRHEALFDFVANSSNTSLMKAATGKLAGDGQHDEVFELLLLLKQQGFDQRQIKDILEYSGRMAAIHLRQSNPDLRPATYIREKTNNDSWFNHYTRSFLKNWSTR
jgi:hypothetical protein